MAEHLGSPGVAFRNPFPKEGCREPGWTCGPPERPMSDEVASWSKPRTLVVEARWIVILRGPSVPEGRERRCSALETSDHPQGTA